MAQSYFKIPLQNTDFPLLSEQQTRTVITVATGKSSEGDPETSRPGIAYCHNVMPTKRGLDSVGFDAVVNPITDFPVDQNLRDARLIFGSNNTRIDMAWTNTGEVYALLPEAVDWIPVTVNTPPEYPTPGGPDFFPGSVSIGTVNGVSYIYYSAVGAYIYDEDTNTLEFVLLVGLSLGEVIGITASSGYLLAFTKDAVAWSSTINPADFIPSQVTGAGGANIAEIDGRIQFATPNDLGFFIWTFSNVIAATYTGSPTLPFKFREVKDSKGGINLDRIAYESNSESQFAYTKAGLQALTANKANNILPSVTDFLAGRRLETYNTITREFDIEEIPEGSTMSKKLKFVSSRYLVISYGFGEFSHALIYDTALDKLGKVLIDHTDVLEYVGLGGQDEVSKESIGFILRDGEIRILNFTVNAPSVGVLILGKLQERRTRYITLLGVELENYFDAAFLSVSTNVALNGKDFSNVEGTLLESTDDYREYGFLSTGKNHSVVLIGKFNLVTPIIRYTLSGRR